MDPRKALLKKLLLYSGLLFVVYLLALGLWWTVFTPPYMSALAVPLPSLCRIGEGPTPIVREIEPDGREIRITVQGYEDRKSFPVLPVVHGNLPIFWALALVGLVGVSFRKRLVFLLVGGVVLYAFHILDIWLSIRLVACDPGKVGDIAMVAFTDFETRVYDWGYNFMQFARRFLPVALYVFAVIRFGVVQTLLGHKARAPREA